MFFHDLSSGFAGLEHLDKYDLGDLAVDPDYASAELRSRNRVALNEAIAARSRVFSSHDLIGLLNEAGVPCGPIYKMNEVFEDEQVKHLGLSVAVPKRDSGEVNLVGPAIRLSRTPSRMKHTVGPAGEHNEEIFQELGYDEAEIAALRSDKVI